MAEGTAAIGVQTRAIANIAIAGEAKAASLGFGRPALSVTGVVGAGGNDAAVATLTVAIGEDSTTTAHTNCVVHSHQTMVNNRTAIPSCDLFAYPAAGQHVYVWLEQSAATNTTTWLGDDGASNYFTLMGITGSIDG